MSEEKIIPVTEEEMDDIRVTLNLDEGDIECRIVTIFDVAGLDYIAFEPLDLEGNPIEEGCVYIYRYAEEDQGLPSIDYIEDEEEYEAAADRFDELLDEDFYDSLDD